ncbi:MAG: hypothetical protein WA800_04675, partial [Terriglobales bacterium]
LWELAEILPGRKPCTETSALLESFAVHLRNLIEFFAYPKKGGYVRAGNFFDEPDAWPLAQSPELDKLSKRANEQVTHLTENRVSGNPPEKEWNVGEMVQVIDKVAKRFAQTASPKKLAPAVREFLGLPSSQIAAWIGDNITRSNVAVQSVTAGHVTRAFPSPNPSTSTVIK